MLSAKGNFLEKEKSIDVIYHLNVINKKKHDNLIDAKKVIEKIHRTFPIGILGKDQKETSLTTLLHLGVISMPLLRPTANVTINEEMLETFPLKSGIQ